MPTATKSIAVSPEIVARFWANVNRKGPRECWEWTGFRARGYGRITLHPHGPFNAHRLSWVLAYGSIPDNLYVCHACDNPPCVNPNHLFLGTDLDNKRDAASKHRYTVPRRKKLTLADRLAIHAAPRDRETGGRLAREYGVSKVMIHHIRRGRFVQTDRRLEPIQPLTESRTDLNQLTDQGGESGVLRHASATLRPDPVGALPNAVRQEA